MRARDGEFAGDLGVMVAGAARAGKKGLARGPGVAVIEGAQCCWLKRARVLNSVHGVGPCACCWDAGVAVDGWATLVRDSARARAESESGPVGAWGVLRELGCGAVRVKDWVDWAAAKG